MPFPKDSKILKEQKIKVSKFFEKKNSWGKGTLFNVGQNILISNLELYNSIMYFKI